MLIQDPLLSGTGLKIGVTNKQGYFVVGIQILPQGSGERINVIVHSHTLGFALEGGDHRIAIADIGVQEMTQAGSGRILPEEPGAGVAFRVSRKADRRYRLPAAASAEVNGADAHPPVKAGGDRGIRANSLCLQKW